MPKQKLNAKLRVSEADVQQAVVLMLELDNWRSLRTDPVSNRARGTGFGEPGMPDYLFIRYLHAGGKFNGTQFSGMVNAEILFIEFKKPGEKEKPHQKDWHNRERTRGALVMVFDSFDAAREWYKTSGLMRNTILS